LLDGRAEVSARDENPHSPFAVTRRDPPHPYAEWSFRPVEHCMPTLAQFLAILVFTQTTTAPSARPTTRAAPRAASVPSYAGPWNDCLTVLRLRDGQPTERLATEPIRYAVSPALLRRGRELLAIFEYYSRERKADFGRLAQAGSNDGGKTWSKPRAIAIAG